MKKVIFIFAIICSVFQSIGQKVFQTKIGYSSIDDKGIVGNTTLTTPSMVAIVDFQSDGPKTVSISAGPNLAKLIWHDHEAKLSIMPGILSDWGRKELFYSGTLFLSREKENRPELLLIIKNIRGEEKYSKWILENEFLWGKTLKFGPCIESELQKEKGVFEQKPAPDVEMIFTDFIFSIGGKLKWSPKILKDFSLSGFAGWENKERSGRLLTSRICGVRYDAENKFVWGLNLNYKF